MLHECQCQAHDCKRYVTDAIKNPDAGCPFDSTPRLHVCDDCKPHNNAEAYYIWQRDNLGK